MKSYDPNQAPDPQQWLALSETKRIELVRRFHRRSHIQLPNELVHATFHVIVENQIALGDQLPVASTLDRLMREGLDRHDAVHAIGYVLAGHMWDLQRGAVGPEADPNEAYFEQLKALSARSWREEFS